jgi:DNA-binding NarL/FixJ family response regulator
VRVCALVSDLMDRSRISAALPDVAFMLDGTADVVIIDLARGPQLVPEIRAEMPAVRIVCYGPHVDEEAADAARAAGADVVLPRSRFFRDPAAAIAP